MIDPFVAAADFQRIQIDVEIRSSTFLTVGPIETEELNQHWNSMIQMNKNKSNAESIKTNLRSYVDNRLYTFQKIASFSVKSRANKI